MYVSPHVMYSLFLSHFNRPSIFSTAFQKILYYHNLDNENPSSGGQVFHADRHQELSIRFSPFFRKRLKHGTQFGYI